MYRIGIDIGGTFTDLVAASGTGEVTEAKVPSNRENPEIALAKGLEELANAVGAADVLALLSDTSLVIQGTTVALNAVLQGAGAKTALLCTGGFRDTLAIRLGYKEERYVFGYTPPPPIVPRHLRLPIGERVNSNGEVTLPLAEADVKRATAVLREEEIEAVGICFLWSFLNADHERRAAEMVRRELPDVFVSVSSDVLPKIREYNRASTTVLNAYVGPIVQRYVDRTERILRDLGFGGRIRYIQSNGGLAEAAEVTRRPVLLLMSGPAAAPAAGLQFTEITGPNFITVDMGGTSFDACIVRDGLPETRDVADLNGYRVATRLIDVQTIGSGGGSIATLDAGLLRVGPESAEAYPGPACYRRGGTEATVTDANVVAGFLNPVELLGGRFQIDGSLAEEAVDHHVANAVGLSVREAASGIIDVVCRDMSEAIREISVRRGRDPRDYSLLVGGGAGGLHAAQLADELGIVKVVVPRIASALCAYGAVVADIRHDYGRSYVGDTRTVNLANLEAVFTELEGAARVALADEAIPQDRTRLIRSLELRYRDQVYECEIDVSDLALGSGSAETRAELERRFHEKHGALYEFNQPGYPCQVVSANLSAIGTTSKIGTGGYRRQAPVDAQSKPEIRSVVFGRQEPPVDVDVVRGERIRPGERIEGPAIIEEPNTTIVVPPAWVAVFRGEVQAYELTRRGDRTAA